MLDDAFLHIDKKEGLELIIGNFLRKSVIISPWIKTKYHFHNTRTSPKALLLSPCDPLRLSGLAGEPG